MADTARNQFDQPIRGVSLWLDAWRRLRKNRMAVIGLVLVVLCIIVAVLAPVLPIYSYKQQVLGHQYLPPSLTKNAGQLLFERQERLLITAAQVKSARAFRYGPAAARGPASSPRQPDGHLRRGGVHRTNERRYLLAPTRSDATSSPDHLRQRCRSPSASSGR
jgi:oligopeptide transport system permease protein